MTREEIINTPKLVDFMLDESVIADSREKLHKRLDEVCNLAIKALEQEPCEDTISRQAVFEQINCWIGSGEYRYTNATDYLNKRIKALQAVNPQEPKTDTWSIKDVADTFKKHGLIREQEPCEDEYIKVPKKALKYRTAGMVAYNVEWLKNHFDIERAVICGAQEPTGHWILVSERLPKSCGMYIVTRKIYDCPDTAPIIMSDESWFDGQNTWHNDNRINHKRGYLSDVIAWMPLPEPYKAESDNCN